jgi:hypothetical protein
MLQRHISKQPKRKIMKTLFLFAALLLASATTKTFANDVKVNPAVRQTFESLFGRAVAVKWSMVDHLYKADFNVNGEQTAAFFSAEDGSLVASGWYLTVADLPRTLQRSLKEAAGTDLVTEVFEVQSDAGTDYYATLKKQNETVILKAGTTTWNVFKKN